MVRRVASSPRTARSRGQLGSPVRSWGGARAGAGRPPLGGVAGVSHLRRGPLSRHHPLHVTLRVLGGLPSFRARALFRCVRRALAQGRERLGFRLVQFSVQRDHVHLIVEVGDRRALSRGIQGLSIRVARAVNAELGRKGRVFADRYEARALTTPSEVRLALRHVLLNVRKPEGRGARAVAFGWVDPCSSAAWFEGLARPGRLALAAAECRADFARDGLAEDAPVVAARTWLLRVGYRRAGALDVDDAPEGTGVVG